MSFCLRILISSLLCPNSSLTDVFHLHTPSQVLDFDRVLSLSFFVFRSLIFAGVLINALFVDYVLIITI